MSAPLKTASVVLNQEEARVLIQIIDAAIKSLGLQAAESGAFLAKKIQTSFEEKKDVV